MMSGGTPELGRRLHRVWACRRGAPPEFEWVARRGEVKTACASGPVLNLGEMACEISWVETWAKSSLRAPSERFVW